MSVSKVSVVSFPRRRESITRNFLHAPVVFIAGMASKKFALNHHSGLASWTPAFAGVTESE